MNYLQTTTNEQACQNGTHWLPENTVEIEQKNLLRITEIICTDRRCRYRQLALRLLLHIICYTDECGCVHINAGRLAKTLGVHYDTLVKCIKYLREIEVLHRDK